jgi:TRAP-type C4-dicarboxylate transport system permease small subunit
MRAFLRAIDLACAAGAAFAAAAVGLLALMLIAEVLTVWILDWSQPWAVEYSGYFLAASLFAGAGWTLGQGGHVRVTLLTGALPPGLERIVDIAATAFALGVSAFATRAVALYALRSWEISSVSYYPSRTPLAYHQGVLAAGLALLTLALFARLVRRVMGWPAEAGQVSGPEAGPKAP